MSQPLQILYLEDNKYDAELVIESLQNDGLSFTIKRVSSKADYIAALESKSIDIILSDFNLPNFSGKEALHIAKEQSADTPFILVTGALGEDVVIDLVKDGITDYVLKDRLSRIGFVVRRAISEAAEIQNRKRAEQEQLETHRKLEMVYQETYKLAFTDSLTKLPNRHSLVNTIESYIANRQEPFHLLLVNLDGFRFINYRTGYEIGDQILLTVAERIKSVLFDSIAFGRLSADSFLIMTTANSSHSIELAEKIRSSLHLPIVINDHEFLQVCTVSIVSYPEDGTDNSHLLKTAEIAVRQAKQDGGDQVKYFNQSDRNNLKRRLEIENALQDKEVFNEFHLVFQPKGKISNFSIVSAEALVRWNSNQLGPIPPIQFVPVAESTGLIGSMSQWILDQSLTTLERLTQIGFENLTFAVNLSPIHMIRPHFLDDLMKVMSAHSIAANKIELEITEGLLLHNSQRVAELLTKLHEIGFQIALDDFGTGFSNLSYLSKFQVDTIKLDRSFITNIHQNETNRSILKAIISLAQSSGSQTVAEGIETEQELQVLQDLGCDLIQGYYLSKPLIETDLVNFLTKHQSSFDQSA